MSRSALPAKFNREDVTAIVDTREQTPLDLSPLKTQPGTLATGDYTVLGLEQHVAIERKSLPDLLACVGRERERFEREIHRLLAYPVRAVVVEACWEDVWKGDWRSQVTPESLEGSILGWIAKGVPFVLSGSHRHASHHVAQLLYTVAKRRYVEARVFLGSLESSDTSNHVLIKG